MIFTLKRADSIGRPCMFGDLISPQKPYYQYVERGVYFDTCVMHAREKGLLDEPEIPSYVVDRELATRRVAIKRECREAAAAFACWFVGQDLEKRGLDVTRDGPLLVVVERGRTYRITVEADELPTDELTAEQILEQQRPTLLERN